PPAPFHVLIETQGSNEAHDTAKLHNFTTAVLASEVVLNGAIAQTLQQAARLWALRDDATAALSHRGDVLKYDLSFPVPHMYDVVSALKTQLAPWEHRGVVVVGFGHLADGNIHLNVSFPSRGDVALVDAVRAEVEPFVFEWTCEHGG